jgi:hypothetical protein
VGDVEQWVDEPVKMVRCFKKRCEFRVEVWREEENCKPLDRDLMAQRVTMISMVFNRMINKLMPVKTMYFRIPSAT